MKKTLNRTYCKGTNPLSAEEIELERLARQYHEQCEEFAKKSCNSAIRRGTLRAIEESGKQMANHYKKQFRELTNAGKKLGFDKQSCTDAAHFVGVFIKNGL
jgi:flagellar biosynthesis/type III secretory pathway protein FliH